MREPRNTKMDAPNNIAMLTEAEVAEAIGVSPVTLRMWRWQKKGPRYYKIGRQVRYKPEDITAYCMTHPVETIESSKIG